MRNFILMRHICLVVTCNSEKWLKSVYIWGSYCKINTAVSLFLDHPVYIYIADSTFSGLQFWRWCWQYGYSFV